MFEKIKEDLKSYGNIHNIIVEFVPVTAILVYRLGFWFSSKMKLIRFCGYLFYYPLLWISLTVSGIQIPKRTRIGKGLRIHHFGTLIINQAAVIGDYCTLRPGVVIGNLHDGNDVPVIGDHVSIGAGAKILGSCKIGNYAKIGANAVVLKDVPEYATAVGIPARIITK